MFKNVLKHTINEQLKFKNNLASFKQEKKNTHAQLTPHSESTLKMDLSGCFDVKSFSVWLLRWKSGPVELFQSIN